MLTLACENSHPSLLPGPEQRFMKRKTPLEVWSKGGLFSQTLFKVASQNNKLLDLLALEHKYSPLGMLCHHNDRWLWVTIWLGQGFVGCLTFMILSYTLKNINTFLGLCDKMLRGDLLCSILRDPGAVFFSPCKPLTLHFFAGFISSRPN